MEWMNAVWYEAFPPTLTPQHSVALCLRLVMAAFLGGLIGLQRQRQRKSAGLRTHMLVALGSALFVLVPLEIHEAGAAEMSRVVQGIATGIGFLGGGAILKMSHEHKVSGLTSAAAIWVTAGLGVAIAFGMIWTALMIVALSWLVLAVLGWAERFPFFRKHPKRDRVPQRRRVSLPDEPYNPIDQRLERNA